jgi:hypothetical protein
LSLSLETKEEERREQAELNEAIAKNGERTEDRGELRAAR